jgi:DNA-binding MarR family transcriptional regulator
MSSVLATLNRRELIERKPHPIHTHILETRLTRSGRALLKQADKAAIAVEQHLSDAFTREEAEQLIEFLGRCAESAAKARVEASTYSD